jgi:hypothetical protein
MTIEELKQALEAATPGPWEVDASSDYGTAVCENGNSFIAAWTRSMHRKNYPHRANARLIVAAVNNLPALLKVVEAADYLHRVRTSLREVASDQEGRLPYCYEGGWSDLSKALEELNDD